MSKIFFFVFFFCKTCCVVSSVSSTAIPVMIPETSSSIQIVGAIAAVSANAKRLLKIQIKKKKNTSPFKVSNTAALILGFTVVVKRAFKTSKGRSRLFVFEK